MTAPSPSLSLRLLGLLLLAWFSGAQHSLGAVALPVHEITRQGTKYRWTHKGAEQARDEDLAKLLQQAIGTGGRAIHLRSGGKLARTIRMEPDLEIHGHGHTFEKTHNGTGFSHQGRGGIALRNFTLTGGTGWGVHTTRASNITLEDLRIIGGGIGVRVDSHPSRPYEENRWVRNLTVRRCTFEQCAGHGLETYGVEDFIIEDITAKQCGECGVLVNKGRNGKVGTVRAWRCCVGGGYAGLRFANHCRDITVEKLVAIECGRGFFTVSNCANIIVREVEIRDCSSHAILIQHSDGVGIERGTYNGVGLVHYTSKNSWIKARHREGHKAPQPDPPAR
jgi:hypothetical protein